jgi:hypothetical protein
VKPANPTFLEKWEVTEGHLAAEFPWRVQLVSNVGHFKTEQAADRYITAVKEFRVPSKVL